MSNAWKARLDGALRGGEVAGLYFTTALLIVVEFCFVCWLNRIQIPDVPNAGSGFIVLPPWYQKPRFEVTLLLTILAGLLFSVCWGSGICGKREPRRDRGRRLFSRLDNASRRLHSWPR
jgi:hypothetical protein